MIVDGNEGEGERSFADFESQVESGGDSEGGEKTDPNAEDPGEGDEEGDEPNPNVNDDADGEGEDDADDEGDEDGKPKKPKASDRIRELNRKYREEQRAREIDRKGFEARLAAIEGKKPLTDDDDSGNKADERVAPDPKDLKKYPLGALDDRFIQDTIDFKAEQAAVRMVDSLLQRQEQNEEQKAAEALLTDLRSKADNVVAKGSELHDDFESVVLEAGLQGEYELTQITFEAAAEAENGAQILYDLAVDREEATRVAQLSPLMQLKYVAEKDAELSKGSAKGKLPGANPPPTRSPRGGSNRKTISPATPNFAEFERLANKS